MADPHDPAPDEVFGASHYPDPPRLVAPYGDLQAHGVPGTGEINLIYFNQAPRTPHVERLLGLVSTLTADLAAWCEANIPHSPELATAIGAGGPLDELRGLLKAAVIRRHPDQVPQQWTGPGPSRFPNRYELPTDLPAAAEESNPTEGNTE